MVIENAENEVKLHISYSVFFDLCGTWYFYVYKQAIL